MTNTCRPWLVAALTHATLPPIAEPRFVEIINLADENGVLVMLDKRLQNHPRRSELPSDLLMRIQTAAKQTLFDQLVFQAEQKKVLAVLNSAKIPYILMKGAALGHWLYESPMDRPVTDIDIWLKDQQAVFSLSELLQPLGYVCQPLFGAMTTQEQAFDKTTNGMTIRIDAHWQMFNSALLARHIEFDAFYARAVCIDALEPCGKYLAINDALINSIGHRAKKCISKNGYVLKWLLDQHLLFSQLSAEQWQDLVTQSHEYGISDLTLDAVQICTQQFATHVPESVLLALKQQAKHESVNRRWFQSWARYQWHEMRAVSPKFTERLRWLCQRLWPDSEAMRARYDSDDPVWKFMFKRLVIGLKRFIGR